MEPASPAGSIPSRPASKVGSRSIRPPGFFRLAQSPSLQRSWGSQVAVRLTQFYSLVSDAWGKYAAPSQVVGAGSPTSTPLLGDFSAFSEQSSTQVIYDKSAANNLRRYAPGAFSATYTGSLLFAVVTSWALPNQKTLFKRLIANLRVRTNGSSAVASLSASFYPQSTVSSGAFARRIADIDALRNLPAPYRFDFTARMISRSSK
jgi:hypothetical protein